MSVCGLAKRFAENLRGLRRNAPVRAACRSLTRSLGKHLLKWNRQTFVRYGIFIHLSSLFAPACLVHVHHETLQETSRWISTLMSRPSFWLSTGAMTNELLIIVLSPSNHALNTRNWVRRIPIHHLVTLQISGDWPCTIVYNSLCSLRFWVARRLGIVQSKNNFDGYRFLGKNRLDTVE